MDHSLQGYLERQTTPFLLDLLSAYPKDAQDIDGSVRRTILRILAQRGITEEDTTP